MRDRTWKKLTLAALLGPAVVLAGCSSDPKPQPVPEQPATPEAPAVVLAEPVKIIDYKQGDSQAFQDLGVMLIKTQAEYDKLGDADIFPGIDFDKHDLVIATLGQRNTGGYTIQITALQLQGEALFVVGKATAPGPDDIVTQALTYPYYAVVIDNTTATYPVQAID